MSFPALWYVSRMHLPARRGRNLSLCCQKMKIKNYFLFPLRVLANANQHSFFCHMKKICIVLSLKKCWSLWIVAVASQSNEDVNFNCISYSVLNSIVLVFRNGLVVVCFSL